MSYPISKLLLKSLLFVTWLISGLYYSFGGNFSSIVLVWLSATIASLAFLISIRKSRKYEKCNVAFFLLLGLTLFISLVAFGGMLFVDSTKEEMLVNSTIIDDWIRLNIFETMGFSFVVVVGTILPGTLLNLYSRLLVIVNMLYAVISIIVSAHLYFLLPTNVSGNWQAWFDKAWLIQDIYFHCFLVFALVAFCVFVYRTNKNIQ
ncbi:MAG: hypothetical protein MJZ07_07340 [Bacteroidales bacterium]|nr:hypothetical protein [Bacteroidales bacterium]